MFQDLYATGKNHTRMNISVVLKQEIILVYVTLKKLISWSLTCVCILFPIDHVLPITCLRAHAGSSAKCLVIISRV